MSSMPVSWQWNWNTGNLRLDAWEVAGLNEIMMIIDDPYRTNMENNKYVKWNKCQTDTKYVRQICGKFNGNEDPMKTVWL